MGSTQVAHALNSSALSEAQSSALARIYTRALERYYERKKAAEPAPEPDSRNDTAIVRNTEGVSHVDQRPDRPSEIDHQRLTIRD
jgi:hypothetical protein